MVLAWGERNDPYLFELFCERQVLSYFVGALLTSRTAPSVRLQLLQTMCRGQGLQGISG
ncbi:unnamed protein product [Effrenium voratum]|nr:unnamed protein product [Effrenium voratum]